MWAAGGGVPLRHDPGRHHLCGSAFNVFDLFSPGWYQPGGHRYRAGLALPARRRRERQRAHFDGLPVEFIAEAIATLGAQVVDGFETYHVMNPHDDGIEIDEYVDCLVEGVTRSTASVTLGSGCSGLLTALRALPDGQRQYSVLREYPGLYCAIPSICQTAEPVCGSVGADRPIPCCGARSEDWTGQRGTARLGADDHQIRHRVAGNCSDCFSPIEDSNPHSRKFVDLLQHVVRARPAGAP